MTDPDFHDIAAEEEIPVGTVRAFVVGGRRIAVAHPREGIFAVDDGCPHRGGPLSEGDLQGCEIICPWHFWAFDLQTGRHTGGSRFAVCTFRRSFLDEPMNPKPLRHIDLRSDAGRLEALYREIPDPAAVAIVCHPLPTHGGTMHNKVVFRAAKGLEDADVATLRFNFRGAGASQGRFEAGEGEQRDFEAALKWMRKKHPDKPVIAGGFSFGSWVSSRVSCDSADVNAVFLIGAPINKYSMHYLRSCEKPKLVIQGDQDEFGDAEKLAELAVQWPETETIIVEGAGHFFDRQLDFVQESMRQWATQVIERL